MKKLVGIALIVCMFFSIFLCGCGGKGKVSTEVGSILKTDDSPRTARFKAGQITYVESPKKEIISGNYAVEKDGWIYYQSNAKSLEKMKNDGSGRVKLCDGEPSQILIVSDWIYFNTRDGIFRVKTDGKEFKRLSAMRPQKMTVEGDWLYFVGDESYIYRVKIDGTGESLLSDEPSLQYIEVAGDAVYYFKEGNVETVIKGSTTTSEGNFGLYKMKTDGTGKTLLDGEKGWSSYIQIDGDWLNYDVSRTEKQENFKIRLDGTGKMKTDDDSIAGKVYKDWFYFRDTNDLSSLYRMRLDGTEKTKIIGNSPSSWKFKNDHIYYSTWSNERLSLIKIKTDGSDMKQLVTDLTNSISLVGDWIYCPGKTQNYLFSTDGTDRQVLDPPVQTKQ